MPAFLVILRLIARDLLAVLVEHLAASFFTGVRQIGQPTGLQIGVVHLVGSGRFIERADKRRRYQQEVFISLEIIIIGEALQRLGAHFANRFKGRAVVRPTLDINDRIIEPTRTHAMAVLTGLGIPAAVVGAGE